LPKVLQVLVSMLLCIFIGLGYAICMVSYLCCIYYIVILCWTFYFLFMSFTSTVPWSSCDNDWNTPYCRYSHHPFVVYSQQPLLLVILFLKMRERGKDPHPHKYYYLGTAPPHKVFPTLKLVCFFFGFDCSPQ